MAMRMAAAAAVALVAVMCVAPRAEWCGGSSTEDARNHTVARCYTGNTPDADAATPATPPPAPPRREDDELVVDDGWPTWLLNNVPREALEGILHKSVVGAYEKMDKVGQGSHSTVYRARERDTGRVVALKKVRFNASDSESVRFMAREIEFQRRLDHHPNVMKLEAVATSRRRRVYLVFEFMDDDLARIVFHSGNCLTEMQIKGYMQQLLEGLQHCHERGILHLDIKPSNMLIDGHGVLKIGDFGLASDYGAGSRLPHPSHVVSLWHRPPELLLGSTSYGVGVDLWSAGCLLAEMFFGETLVRGSGEKGQLLKIFSLLGSPPDDYWRKMELSPSLKPPETYESTAAERFRNLPPSTVGLLATLLALDPGARGTAGQALQSSFFSTPPLPCNLSPVPVVYKAGARKPRSRRHLGVINLSFRPGVPLNVTQALNDAELTDDEWSDDELTDTANSGQEPVTNTGNAGQESAAAAAHDASSEKTIVGASFSTVAKRFSASPVVQDTSPAQNQMVAQDQKQVPTANTSHHHSGGGNDDHDDDHLIPAAAAP